MGAMHVALRVTILLLLVVVPTLAAQSKPARIFVFHTDEVWLNLHQFLYVLGRHEAQMPDRTRRATAGAPADAEHALSQLGGEEQRSWRDAVTFYANGPSRLDAVFDEPLVAAGQALARVATGSSLEGAGLDPALAATLTKVRPIYQKAWWPAHQQANHAWVRTTQNLLDAHGAAVLTFVTRAYQLPWPASGYPVHVSGYANWAGAFSTRGNLLIISSLDTGNHGTSAFETVFHEAMHQWDDPVDAALGAEAAKQKRAIAPSLSHALIFYTAGEAVRSVIPAHVGYAEANGLWPQSGLGALKPALDASWKPYLNGNGTRAEAFAALVGR
jgi:hypothetical protein